MIQHLPIWKREAGGGIHSSMRVLFRGVSKSNSSLHRTALFIELLSSLNCSLHLAGMRGKPRPSGRGRIAPTPQASYTPSVARPTAGQAGSNACGDMSSAIRRSARKLSEATCSGATPAMGAVGIFRLEAGEDVKHSTEPQ